MFWELICVFKNWFVFSKSDFSFENWFQPMRTWFESVSDPSVEVKDQRREAHRISVARQRSAARQSVHELQRTAVNQFRQSVYAGPFNPCYCCTRLCYSNGGSFMDVNSPLLLPIHEGELSDILTAHGNSVWICSRCKTSLNKHKLPSFASVNNMHVPPVPSELSCLN